MKKVDLAGAKNPGSEFAALLGNIKTLTGKTLRKMAVECGYETVDYFSQVLRDEKNGTPVPALVLRKVNKTYGDLLGDKVVVQIPQDDIINTLMEHIAALKTQVSVLTSELAEVKAHVHRADFQSTHDALKVRMKEGVAPMLRTIVS